MQCSFTASNPINLERIYLCSNVEIFVVEIKSKSKRGLDRRKTRGNPLTRESRLTVVAGWNSQRKSTMETMYILCY